MLFKSKGSSGQKLVFLGPGTRDTWHHEDATRGSKWGPLQVAKWNCMHDFRLTLGLCESCHLFD